MRVFATLLFLIWSIQPSAAAQGEPVFASGQDAIAADHVALPPILFRDIARPLGAEAFRSKSCAYSFPHEHGGDLFGLVPGSHLQVQPTGEVDAISTRDVRLNLPLHAFDARGPPAFLA